MSETVIVNAASVIAGASSAVDGFLIPVPPQIQFRAYCDQVHSVRFYVADADFSAISAASLLSAYTETGVASTAGTLGNVYTIDVGAYDYIACVVKNDSASPATVTIAAGYDLISENPTALFTVAEARAFDKMQLASATDYPDAAIISFEAAFRQWFDRALGANTIPTAHTDEVRSGDGTLDLLMKWPLITAVSAASYRVGDTWTPFTADQLAEVYVDPDLTSSCLYSEDLPWYRGRANIKVSYTAGFASVPALIKEAALTAAVEEIPANNVPFEASSFDAGGGSYTFERADGYNESWSKLPIVMRAIRMYGQRLPGIA